MKNKIPILLIYSRLIIGFVLILLSYLKIEHYSIYSISLLTIGLLTDVFDGIIARHLNISNQQLRRLDSTIDQIFFISVAIATYIQCPAFFADNALKLIVLFSIEALTYIVSFVKFKREIATHSIGAKLWTLTIFATLIQVMAQCQSGILFNICFWSGIVTRIEIIAIIVILKNWTNDVPTFYHAIKLKQGKTIKRHKLFNG
ncbi:CDP-alcohol phosphatidyltransferase family protein [Polluticaenibacter yanchengensis]|uniref:CDP-alcohol phosphatidyltransferase family protein n=1 Tax=Polluticaenibacter yanchengensis TaxID=3014562 RepID=A0ABT4UIW7_9BACT|nr:CDP-alcohol phosphatidyltransferase family protein [Chitinophagaceae bacterium LY-5]